MSDTSTANYLPIQYVPVARPVYAIRFDGTEEACRDISNWVNSYGGADSPATDGDARWSFEEAGTSGPDDVWVLYIYTNDGKHKVVQPGDRVVMKQSSGDGVYRFTVWRESAFNRQFQKSL